MNKTSVEKLPETCKQTVDTTELMQILSCGRKTAVEIGTASGARIQIGRRVLWNLKKIEAYLDAISGD